MSNNKTEKEMPKEMRDELNEAKHWFSIKSETKQGYEAGAEWMYAKCSSRLATLQAENEKLWKLLEERVRAKALGDYVNEPKSLKRETHVLVYMDEAWAAFQKANELTQNKM